MIKLFQPYVSLNMRTAVGNQLRTSQLTQGERVIEFEDKFRKMFNTRYNLSVNSATSALELAYHLLDLKPGDEVITPVFTCTATNIPLVRRGVKIVFADVKDNLMLDWEDVINKVTERTKAIINVHLWGKQNEHCDLGIPIINDSAQYLGNNPGKFSAYSFQAVKMLTTVDGGMLVCDEAEDYLRAKLLRWFGIDREAGIPNIEVDIPEAGYKYHMNDVTAAMGIAALDEFKQLKTQRERLEQAYFDLLQGVERITLVGGIAPMLALVENRNEFQGKLAEKEIETGLGHLRNDQYTVFGGRQKIKNMDRLESKYVLLPLHNHMTHQDVVNICEVIKEVV